MTLSILGKKLGMTRLYDEKGAIVPVTVIQAGPCPIVQIKTASGADGYSSVQIGYDAKPERKVKKPEAGHFKRCGVGATRVLREFRIDDASAFELGGNIEVDAFEVGDKVDVIGVSKGRGFAGPMKRHGSSRGPESHGSRYHRRPGSLGASATPSRVFKGKKVPGRMGGKRVTMQNLKVVKVDKARNILIVRGAIPGHENGYVLVAKSKRAAIRDAARARK